VLKTSLVVKVVGGVVAAVVIGGGAALATVGNPLHLITSEASESPDADAHSKQDGDDGMSCPSAKPLSTYQLSSPTRSPKPHPSANHGAQGERCDDADDNDDDNAVCPSPTTSMPRLETSHAADSEDRDEDADECESRDNHETGESDHDRSGGGSGGEHD
jgi:hypothetical protein